MVEGRSWLLFSRESKSLKFAFLPEFASTSVLPQFEQQQMKVFFCLL